MSIDLNEFEGALSESALNTLFLKARTYHHWSDTPVSEQLLHQLYETVKYPPTSMNCQPMRLQFVVSQDAKQKLKPCLMSGNVEQTLSAPVVVIIAHDTRFYQHLPRMFPAYEDAQRMYSEDDKLSQETAFRNGSMQGAYLIIAARALGLDCGPMSGFDNAKIDETFLSGTDYQSNFLLNLGYGDETRLYERGDRFAFDEVAEIV